MRAGRAGLRSIAACLLLAACAVLLAVGWLSGLRVRPDAAYEAANAALPVEPAAVERIEGIDVNRADVALLVTLPGIGEKLAQAIVDEREANGPFRYPEDLMAVSGIGEKKLEAIRDMICLSEKDVP